MKPTLDRQVGCSAVAAISLWGMFAAAIGDGNALFLLASTASLLAIVAFHLLSSRGRTAAWFAVGWVTAFVLLAIVLATEGPTSIIVFALGAKPVGELVPLIDSAAGTLGAVAVLSTLLALVAAMCVSIGRRRWGVVGATFVALVFWWALWNVGVSRRDHHGELLRDGQAIRR